MKIRFIKFIFVVTGLLFLSCNNYNPNKIVPTSAVRIFGLVNGAGCSPVEGATISIETLDGVSLIESFPISYNYGNFTEIIAKSTVSGLIVIKASGGAVNGESNTETFFKIVDLDRFEPYIFINPISTEVHSLFTANGVISGEAFVGARHMVARSRHLNVSILDANGAFCPDEKEIEPDEGVSNKQLQEAEAVDLVGSLATGVLTSLLGSAAKDALEQIPVIGQLFGTSSASSSQITSDLTRVEGALSSINSKLNAVSNVISSMQNKLNNLTAIVVNEGIEGETDFLIQNCENFSQETSNFIDRLNIISHGLYFTAVHRINPKAPLDITLATLGNDIEYVAQSFLEFVQQVYANTGTSIDETLSSSVLQSCQEYWLFENNLLVDEKFHQQLEQLYRYYAAYEVAGALYIASHNYFVNQSTGNPSVADVFNADFTVSSDQIIAQQNIIKPSVPVGSLVDVCSNLMWVPLENPVPGTGRQEAGAKFAWHYGDLYDYHAGSGQVTMSSNFASSLNSYISKQESDKITVAINASEGSLPSQSQWSDLLIHLGYKPGQMSKSVIDFLQQDAGIVWGSSFSVLQDFSGSETGPNYMTNPPLDDSKKAPTGFGLWLGLPDNKIYTSGYVTTNYAFPVTELARSGPGMGSHPRDPGHYRVATLAFPQKFSSLYSGEFFDYCLDVDSPKIQQWNFFKRLGIDPLESSSVGVTGQELMDNSSGGNFEWWYTLESQVETYIASCTEAPSLFKSYGSNSDTSMYPKGWVPMTGMPMAAVAVAPLIASESDPYPYWMFASNLDLDTVCQETK